MCHCGTVIPMQPSIVSPTPPYVKNKDAASDSCSPLSQSLLFPPFALSPPLLFKGWNITTSSSWLMLLKPRKSTSCSLSCKYHRKHSRGIWVLEMCCIFRASSIQPHQKKIKKKTKKWCIMAGLVMVFSSMLSSTSDTCFSSIQCHGQGGVWLDPGSGLLLREGHKQCDAAGVGGRSLPPLPENCPQKS